MKKITKIAEITSPKITSKKYESPPIAAVSTDSDAQLESLEAQKTHYEKLHQLP